MSGLNGLSSTITADKLAPELGEEVAEPPTLTNGEYLKIGDFARSYFGRYAGYAQEYLYHYERTQR